jgi:hypothetical protein
VCEASGIAKCYKILTDFNLSDGFTKALDNDCTGLTNHVAAFCCSEGQAKRHPESPHYGRTNWSKTTIFASSLPLEQRGCNMCHPIWTMGGTCCKIRFSDGHPGRVDRWLFDKVNRCHPRNHGMFLSTGNLFIRILSSKPIINCWSK